jgi:transposase
MGEGKTDGRASSVQSAIDNVRKLLAEDKSVTPALRAAIELLISMLSLMAERLIPRNSRNSSVPPSQDPNRPKKAKTPTGKKPGGQPGHKGAALEPVENPDKVVELKVDRGTLPAGEWKSAGVEKRQVFDVEITRVVTEYQAEILENEEGIRIEASFPPGVTMSAQYGAGVKAQAVYMSVYQMVPCDRIAEQFAGQLGIPLSPGSVCNFKENAYKRLEKFEEWVKKKLIEAYLLHLDETGVNIAGRKAWLHACCTDKYTLLAVHGKRGKEGTDAMDIVSGTDAILLHDGWKPYYRYSGHTHALCNAHHLRELTAAEEAGHKWAAEMKTLLINANEEVEKAGGMLDETSLKKLHKRYRVILLKGEAACPPAEEKPEGKHGKPKKTKERNLLERLEKYEEDTLRFASDKLVPFTNNQAERDQRMAKVQQKVSGSFRSIEGARFFCRIRSYISTCQKNNFEPLLALTLLFNGHLPAFIDIGR